MQKRMALAVVLLLISLVACSPQPLPVAPTPIPTLIPATLPAGGATIVAPPPQTPQAPVTGGDALARQGETVFQKNCSVCHNLTAEKKVGPGLQGLFALAALPNGKAVNETNLNEWIHTGDTLMPPIPLSEADTAAVIAYLKEATK